jgi:hypothetical protein
VQRGTVDGHARERHWPQNGDGRQHAGPPDLDVDALDHGHRFGRGEFQRDCPTGVVPGRPQAGASRQLVELGDDTVGFERQGIPARFHPMVVGENTGYTRREPILGTHRQAPGSQPRHRLGRGAERAATLELHDVVQVEAKTTRRRDPRVQLTDRPSRGIPRVGERGQALGRELCVESAELPQRQNDLAPHCQPVGRRVTSVAKAGRHCHDRTEVGRHVLASLAIATSRRLRQGSVLVDEFNG